MKNNRAQALRKRQKPNLLGHSIFFFLGIVFVAFLTDYYEQGIDAKRQAYFEEAAEVRTHALRASLQQHHDVLWALQGLYAANERVSEQMFQQFVETLYSDPAHPYPAGFLALGFVPLPQIAATHKGYMMRPDAAVQTLTFSGDQGALQEAMSRAEQSHTLAATLRFPLLFDVPEGTLTLTLLHPATHGRGSVMGYLFQSLSLEHLLQANPSPIALLNVQQSTGLKAPSLYQEVGFSNHQGTPLRKTLTVADSTFGLIYYADRAALEAAIPSKKGWVFGAGMSLVTLLTLMGYMAERSRHAMVRSRFEAEESNRQKADFLANMSHEIRTPLNGIIGTAELLLKGKLNAKQTQYGNTIIHSAESLLSIINDILDFSKVESGSMDVAATDMDLVVLAENVATLFYPKAKEKKIGLFIHVDPAIQRHIKADPIRLQQVMNNLVNNAIKFTDSGYVSIHLRTHEEGKNKLRLAVDIKDTGIGMSPESCARVFERFVQADSSTTRKFGGSGLGLAICKQLMDMMQGQISVQSKLGDGSVFHFSVPLEKRDVVADLMPDLKGMSLLVAVHHPEESDELVAHLRACGAHPVVSHSDSEARNLIQEARHIKQPYAYVFIDEKLSSKALLTTIHEWQSQPDQAVTEFILLADSHKVLEEEKLAQVGFAALIHKPFHGLQVVHTLLDIQKGRQQPRAQVATAHQKRLFVSPSTHHTLQNEQGFHVNGLRVLVAEDNPTNCLLMKEMLGAWGAEVVFAANGEEAVEKVRRQWFDIVFMDCQMPVMDGFKAAQYIRDLKKSGELKHDVPVVALTANAIKGDRERCLEAGMQDYLTKPIRAHQVQEMVEKWCDLSNLERIIPAEEQHAPSGKNPAQTQQAKGPNGVAHPAAQAHVQNGTSVQRLIDKEALKNVAKLTNGKLKEAVHIYIESSDGYVKDLPAGMKENNWEKIARLTHNLKSTSQQFGAFPLADVAARIEEYALGIFQSGKEESAITVKDDVIRLTELYKQTRAVLVRLA